MSGAGHDPNRLLRFVALAAGDGIAAGWSILLLLIWLDIGPIGALLDRSPESAPIALFILLISFGTSFGFLGIAWGVMVRLPDDQ